MRCGQHAGVTRIGVSRSSLPAAINGHAPRTGRVAALLLRGRDEHAAHDGHRPARGKRDTRSRRYWKLDFKLETGLSAYSSILTRRLADDTLVVDVKIRTERRLLGPASEWSETRARKLLEHKLLPAAQLRQDWTALIPGADNGGRS